MKPAGRRQHIDAVSPRAAMRGFGRLILAFAVATASTTACASSNELAPRWTVPEPFDIDSPPVVDGSTIITWRFGEGMVALDSTSGTVLWRASNETGPVAAGRIVYADRQSPVTQASSLTALDVRDGHELWSHRNAGGALAADDAGVVTGYANGIARYAPDGTKRWSFDEARSYPRRVILNERYVVVSGAHDGAVLSGEIETFDRRTGI